MASFQQQQPPQPIQSPRGINPFTTTPPLPNPSSTTTTSKPPPPSSSSTFTPSIPLPPLPTTTTPPHTPQPPSDQIQTTSSTFTRRRLLPTILIPPILLLLLPPILSHTITEIYVRRITDNRPWSVLAVALLFRGWFLGMVGRYAPSRSEYERAVGVCWGRLEVVAGGVGVGVVRGVGWGLERFGVGGDWGWWERIGWGGVGGGGGWGVVVWEDVWLEWWRVALGAMALSWMVAMRFNRGGIAQCTPFPIPSNPHGGTTPNLSTIAIHTIFHTMGGYFYFRATNPVPTAATDYQTNNDNDDDSTIRTITMMSCVIVSIATLITTYVMNNVSDVGTMGYDTSDKPSYELYIRSSCTTTTTTTNQSLSSSDDGGGLYLRVRKEFITRLHRSRLLSVWLFTPILITVGIILLRDDDDGGGEETAEDDTTTTKTAADYVDQFLLLLLFPTLQNGLKTLLLSTYPKTFFLIIYTLLLDIIVRFTLVTKGVNIDRLLLSSHSYKNTTTKNSNTTTNNNGNGDEYELTAEDVIVQSVLAGLGPTIVEEIVAATSTAAPLGGIGGIGGGLGTFPVMDLETEENRRNDVVVGYVAGVIENGVVNGCTSLEENLLRMMTLESLGGGETESSSSSSPPSSSRAADAATADTKEKGGNETSIDNNEPLPLLPLELSPRHHRTLKRLIRKPNVIPIIRALCAYVGGTAEALRRVTANAPKAPSKYRSSSSGADLHHGTWSFPPCASESSGYAILGAARLVALTILEHSASAGSGGGGGGKAATRRQQNHHNRVYPLIPVVLQSAHRLRRGLLDYAKYRMRILGQSRPSFVNKVQGKGNYDTNTVVGTDNLCKYIDLHYADIGFVLLACDGAAMYLKQVINGHDIANVSRDCDAWLKTLL